MRGDPPNRRHLDGKEFEKETDGESCVNAKAAIATAPDEIGEARQTRSILP